MYRWTFTPYNLEKWNNSKERILFVAPEPNGDNPNGQKLDMGHWFRTARGNNYYKNKRFYTRCEIMLQGINDNNTEDVFNNFRFVDLKAIQGGSQADENHVLDYVENNIEEVMRYFSSNDWDFGLSPHIIVLLGNTAQQIFRDCIWDKVLENKSLKWIGMPHPSHTVGYHGLKYASANIRQHLRPINQMAEKWTYHKDHFHDWKAIE